jgi:hypothetical protein
VLKVSYVTMEIVGHKQNLFRRHHHIAFSTHTTHKTQPAKMSEDSLMQKRLMEER